MAVHMSWLLHFKRVMRILALDSAPWQSLLHLLTTLFDRGVSWRLIVQNVVGQTSVVHVGPSGGTAVCSPQGALTAIEFLDRYGK